MSDRCPKCGTDLIELRSEQESEHLNATDWASSWDNANLPQTYWGFYGYWCKICETMYEPHTKRWLEPWESEEKKRLAGQVQSLSETAKTEED